MCLAKYFGQCGGKKGGNAIMTKKEYAKCIVRIHGTNFNVDQLVNDIYSSTSLGIALEVLGVITPEKYPEEYDYLQNRGGIHTINNKGVVTEREFYETLPD